MLRTLVARSHTRIQPAVVGSAPPASLAHRCPGYGRSLSSRETHTLVTRGHSISTMSSPPSSRRLSQVQTHLAAPGSANGSRAMSSSSSKQRTGGGEAGDEPKVLTMHGGNISTIMLNRPKALNAIDLEMVQLIDEAIRTTPSHTSIVLRGKGRALCSGGDVMAVVTQANSSDPKERQQALEFFKNEFELDYRIAMLSKSAQPRAYISIMDGITMGGGVGLSLHAPIRVATDKTLFAMPETGIGYWPDVGVNRHLSRLDGRVGQYLGMTGARISGEEAYLAGLATHFVPSSVVENALHRLEALPPRTSAAQISETLDEFSVDPFSTSTNEKGSAILQKSPFVGARRIALDYVFAQASAKDVRSALQEIAQGDAESSHIQTLERLGVGREDDTVSAWASETLKALDTKSPRSLQVALMAINQARNLDDSEAFRADMRIATAFCDLGIGRDFFEGVTHTLTKDPKTGKRREGVANWDPKTLDEVDVDRIHTLFFGPVKAAKNAGMQVDVPELARLSDERASSAGSSQPKTVGPLAWEPSYNMFALPSEAECDALREGSHPAAGDYSLEPEEMVQILDKVKQHKPGLAYKVAEWHQRRRQQGLEG